MKTMQITENGKRVVASVEFTQSIREFLAKLHADGVPDDMGIAAAVNLIAWVLAGHDISRPPETPDELEALMNFCDSHAAEIDAAGGVCLATLCNIDCGPHVH